MNLYHFFIYSVDKILCQSCLLTQRFLKNNFSCKTNGDIKQRGSKNIPINLGMLRFVGSISFAISMILLKSKTNFSLFLFQITLKTLRYSGSFCLKMFPVSISTKDKSLSVTGLHLLLTLSLLIFSSRYLSSEAYFHG